jgi:hypothetical protein
LHQQATGSSGTAGRRFSAPGSRWCARTGGGVLWLALLLAVFLRLPPSAAAEPPAGPTVSVPHEYTLKAIFLYSFGRFVQWPESAFSSPQDPFVIGILGEDPFAGVLDQIAAKKTVQQRHIVVRRFAALDEYRQPCHILFVSRSLSAAQQTAVIAKTQGTPVFVIGETPGFAERGAIANFFIDGDRIRFELNVTTARQTQLHMDAKLLSLGRLVGAQRSAASN